MKGKLLEWTRAGTLPWYKRGLQFNGHTIGWVEQRPGQNYWRILLMNRTDAEHYATNSAAEAALITAAKAWLTLHLETVA